MDNLETLKWGALLSAIGIAFGWFLNQVTGWWHVRRDDKRILKRVLYNLFEVHHLMNRFNIDESVEKLIEKLLSKVPVEEQTPQNIKFLRSLIYTEVANFLQADAADELKALEIKYQSSVDDLSKIEPIQAFYLSGKTKILENIKLIDRWFDHATQKYSSEKSEIEVAKNELNDIFSPTIITDSIKELRKEIIELAWKINPVIWWKTKKILNKKSKPDTEFENMFDEILNKLIEVVQPHNRI